MEFRENITVVIAEDNEVSRILLRTALQRMNANIIEVTRSIDLPEAIANNDVDVLLLDVGMRALSAGTLKEIMDKNESDFAIIGLYNSNHVYEKIKAKRLGINRLLKKPIRNERLWQKVARAIN
jgi:DNA-binding NtrC family response regulator